MNRAAAAFAVLFAIAAGCASSMPPPCPAGQSTCGGRCVDPASFQTDAANCGGCGVACGAGATCSAGVCQCPGGETRCDALVPRCRDLQADSGACGTCATRCQDVKPGSTCQAGACSCGGAKPDDCGAFCTDTQVDPANCGSGVAGCGQGCLAYGTCTAGTCGCPPAHPTACTAWLTCSDLTSDPMNCGACGTQCGSVVALGALCTASTCACPTGWGVCDASGSLPKRCADLASSLQDCGTCGTACASGATCASGSCQCPAGQAVCAGNCAVKPSGATCQGGVWTCPAGPTPGCSGQCCTGGQSCCQSGAACQTPHSNGLGQTFYDCAAAYSSSNPWTLAAAQAAADSWSAGTTYLGLCDGSCLGRQTASACAVWCYGSSSFAGKVALLTGDSSCLVACNGFIGPVANVSVAPWQ